uniref:Neuronal vesicle trafficking-associated protein 1 n=1 Tax=Xiphophorus couchianus TaxID=32473 RepID=A0A3B5MJ04_9TELE
GKTKLKKFAKTGTKRGFKCKTGNKQSYKKCIYKVTLLVICALAFLVCVGFLVVYKLYQYDQPCPDSFIYVVKSHCMPTGLYGNYPPQGPGGRGRLFTLINRYNMAKQTITRSVSPWVTIMSEEKVTQQEMETAQKLA